MTGSSLLRWTSAKHCPISTSLSCLTIRYKHTVGVSAVRDLFGTVQNEGASKGILVSTSGYGKASYDFAGGKPLELLAGSNLLYLLKEHAGIDAKIEVPDTWRDPVPDAPEEYVDAVAHDGRSA